MASWQSEAVKDTYRTWSAALSNPDKSRQEPRETNDHWGDLTAEPRGVDYVETDAHGVPAMWAIPKHSAEDRVILCFHGGGFVGGSLYTHRKLYGHLAKQTGARALIATYRHTPEHTHPAQVEDTTAVYRWLLDQGIGAGRIAVEPTMGKRIVRAKRKIATAHIPYRVPTDAELPGRLLSVLRVTYLIFNEGYAASEGQLLVRGELCAEAVRLGRLLCELMPGEAEAWGLLSLMLLHDARRTARVSGKGQWVGLLEQDRSMWDRDQIRQGLVALERALRTKRPGEYQLQAAITALHIQGADADATDWVQIAQLYGVLAERSQSPVVAVNHAAAVGFAAGPERGLELLAPLLGHPALVQYQPLHATHADLLRRAGDTAGAARAYERAISLSANSIERAELERRRHSL